MARFHLGLFAIHHVLFTCGNTINYDHSATISHENDLFTINMTMPNITTTHEDQFVSISYKIPDEELMIVGYSQLTRSNVAHHLALYICPYLASDKPTSDIPICLGEKMTIHGWSERTFPMALSEDIGFVVGRNSPYKYVVLNFHYLTVGIYDDSEHQLTFSRKLRKYSAGFIRHTTSQIYLPPKTQNIRTPFSCHYNGPTISLLAYVLHTHGRGRVNSLYRVRNGSILEIVKGYPQGLQSVYPLRSIIQIQNGDSFVGQCVFDNNNHRIIYAGSTHNDEMCDVLVMYSYETSKTPNNLPSFIGCSGNADNDLVSLIQPDTPTTPSKLADVHETNKKDQNHEEHPMKLFTDSLYTNMENWPDVKSLPNQLGQISGIALNNANNQLIVFHRGSRKWETQYFDEYRFRDEVFGPVEEDVLVHFDTQTGRMNSRWGRNIFYMPHGLTIDHMDNFWLTDIAMHQVLMFKPSNLTHPVLIVGEKFRSGSEKTRFCRPTDVAVMKNGDFFVADGYCNSRIIKFNHKGEYMMQWGSGMTGQRDGDGYPFIYEWNIVHSIALHEDAQILCGADRENFRIQCFHPNTGSFLRQIHVEKKDIDSPIYAIEFASDANGIFLFAVTGGEQTLKKKVYLINGDSGEILTSFDISPHLNASLDLTVTANAHEIYIAQLPSSSSTNALHRLQLSKDKNLPIPTSHKHDLPAVNNKYIHRLLIVISPVCLLIFVLLIVYCVVQIRKKRKLDRLDVSRMDVKNLPTDNSSMFRNLWISQQRDITRLTEVNEEESQLLDFDENNQPSDFILDTETIIIDSNQQITPFINQDHNI